MTILAMRHQKHEGLGFLEKIFEERQIPYRYVDVFEDPHLSVDLSKASALVVLGGAMGVYEADQYPFLKNDRADDSRLEGLRYPDSDALLSSRNGSLSS